MEDFSYYNGEGTELRKVQLRILEIMVEIDHICRKHDIKYWLDGGTLLGAVRHGGFIPWDDDLDICMMHEDYEKFIKIAQKELPENLLLQLPDIDSSYKVEICKVRDKNSFLVTKHDDFTKEYAKGLFVDIFNIEPYPKISKKILKPLMKWMSKTHFFFKVKQDVTFKNFVATITFPILNFCLQAIWSIFCLMPKRVLGKDRFYNTYGTYYNPTDIFPITEIGFENKLFMAPNNSDKVLSSIFGDYMKIPPKEKRITHTIHVEIN